MNRQGLEIVNPLECPHDPNDTVLAIHSKGICTYDTRRKADVIDANSMVGGNELPLR